MDRKVLAAVLLAALLLAGSLAFAQTSSTTVVAPGTTVRIAPNTRVVAVQCPAGLVDGKTIMEYKQYRALPNERMLTMYARPYPGGSMTEIAFTIEKGYGNWDPNSSIDVCINGQCLKGQADVRRMDVGKWCGHVDFAPGWNTVNVWVTTPYGSDLATFDIWGGCLKDKPRMVNWMCPRCKITTCQTSCPVCRTCCP